MASTAVRSRPAPDRFRPERRTRGRCVLAGLLATASLLLPGAAAAGDAVILQRLDKITARTFPVEARIGQLVRFGTLEIMIRKCEKSPPEEPPEDAAFLEINELRDSQPAKLLFRGWMFSSSPGLSSLEHPVYDVWVVSCKNISN